MCENGEGVRTRHAVSLQNTKSIVQKQNDFRTVAPKRLLQLSAAGEVFGGYVRRDTACRVRQFQKGEIPLKTFHRNVFKIRAQQAGHKGGAVLFAPPSKSCRFSHPPSPCAQKQGRRDFAVCGQRLRGHVPSKNTSPTALSWISLMGQQF